MATLWRYVERHSDAFRKLFMNFFPHSFFLCLSDPSPLRTLMLPVFYDRPHPINISLSVVSPSLVCVCLQLIVPKRPPRTNALPACPSLLLTYGGKERKKIYRMAWCVCFLPACCCLWGSLECVPLGMCCWHRFSFKYGMTFPLGRWWDGSCHVMWWSFLCR